MKPIDHAMKKPLALAEIVRYLDELLQLRMYIGPRNYNGLFIKGREYLTSVGLSVNLSLHAIRVASMSKIDLLVTHHPSCFSTDGFIYEDKYRMIRDAGMSLYIAHEPLDELEHLGTADSLASAIGLKIEGRMIRNERTGRYRGVYGKVTPRFSEFIRRIQKIMENKVKVFRVSSEIGRLAVIPGRGAKPEWLYEASSLECRTLLTGEALMFEKISAKELGMNLILVTHYVSEKFGVITLGKLIQRKFKLRPRFIEEPNLG